MLSRLFTALSMTAGLLADQGFAQERPDGYRVGAFVAAPKIAATTSFDSNLFRTETAPKAAMKVTIAPELIIRSDWNRHAVKLELGSEVGLYTNASDDNYVDAYARLSGEVDVTRRFRLSLAVSVERGHDARGGDDVPTLASAPTVFTALNIDAAANLELGRFTLSPFARFRQFDFDDVSGSGGTTIDQDGRDRREMEAGLEIGYASGRAWGVFVRAGLFDIDYRSATSTAGPARDASGYDILAGVQLKLARLVEGRIAAGYTHRDYADAALPDLSTFAVDTAIDWRPTRRIVLVFAANREIAETAVAGASGRITTSAGLQVDYELLRTLWIGADGRFTLSEFRGISRTDKTFDLGINADWSPMRGLSLRPEYRIAHRRSDMPGQDFMAHLFSITATFRFGANK